MKNRQNVNRKAIDNMKNIIFDELGIDINKSKLKKYNIEFIEKRLETYKIKDS